MTGGQGLDDALARLENKASSRLDRLNKDNETRLKTIVERLRGELREEGGGCGYSW